MAGEAAVSKVCQVCGTDVSASPRVKDPTGKYFCKPCAEKAQAAAAPIPIAPARPPSAARQAAGPAPGGGSDDVMSKLVTDALSNTGEQCPSCSRPMSKGGIICAYCGFNRDSGKQVKTRVLKPEAPKGEKGVRQPAEPPLENPVIVGALCAAPGIAVAVLSNIEIDANLKLAATVVYGLVGFGIWIACIRDTLAYGKKLHTLLLFVTFGLWTYAWAFFTQSRRLRGAIIGLLIGVIAAIIGAGVAMAQAVDTDSQAGSQSTGQP
jgi:uncharacterized Zn finger protein (UPF0148 family)